ncbi:MAG TPA: hypothetical protein VLD58_04795 [Gemmatimonadales bacterium]|nr:hypothetical protein [Gemmatimonadales bacterium]
MGEPHQQQQQEGNRGEERVEGERARQEGNVVAIGLMQGAAGEGQPTAQPLLEP